ncbi:uncharacterized protein LAESUDRAFT_699447 [Laetiporus sulphureus 93-53]|uniref:Zn(2)-C6 fungal-type domain-containing protein n=1 Tax=Laetiporus sulphureus 93-53 TaxID=1314785 RepID=A0A165EHI1_9APHY|nr:uncharacterized protein LAESUDRAFT_699447 [Laetiporus sulphureus 93-53]KZT07063.1 hypothetical protein LAESUDRAFT_699447 [Laetiporus sulphureus 93-53]
MTSSTNPEQRPEGESTNSEGRIPRRTPMACQFCRGRKLKCDGRPTCANCSRRNIPCVYVPVSAQNQPAPAS